MSRPPRPIPTRWTWATTRSTTSCRRISWTRSCSPHSSRSRRTRPATTSPTRTTRPGPTASGRTRPTTLACAPTPTTRTATRPAGRTTPTGQEEPSPGANGTKHVYAGTTRIASKLVLQGTPNSNPNGATPFEKDIFFYHPDHIGSTNYVTDLNGKLFEHIEYFPFGESWVEENTNQQRTPYLFSAKELDEETGLYYFGARYYDPRTSVWQTPDPILDKYLPSGDKEKDAKLPGMGGVFNGLNLGLYTYGHQNPLKVKDPDGRYAWVDDAVFVVW